MVLDVSSSVIHNAKLIYTQFRPAEPSLDFREGCNMCSVQHISPKNRLNLISSWVKRVVRHVDCTDFLGSCGIILRLRSSVVSKNGRGASDCFFK